MSFTDEGFNQYHDGTFPTIIGSGLETESQDAHASTVPGSTVLRMTTT
jgi:hypothetical protein